MPRHATTPWLTVVALAVQIQAQTAATVDYPGTVQPIFEKRCLGCHNTTKRSGGLSLATYDDVLNGGKDGAAVRPGSGRDSQIISRITGSAAPQMPLGGTPLSAAEIAAIRTWIDEGARATPKSPPAKPKWEAPLWLTRPAVPDSPWKNWESPLDRFTASYLARRGVKEVPPVSDALFARRVYLDVWGLLPEPKDLAAFVTDTAPGKRQALVAALLADSKTYSEHWISYWNDLLRNDEGVQYYSETASRKSISQWLLSSLASNRPFDQWIRQLLNPTVADDPDGFLIGVNWRGTVSASQTPALQAAQNTAQIFLGVNLKCNSCHDSFISKWKLRDAYSLAAYFSAQEELQLYRCDTVQQQFAKAAFLYPELNRPLPSQSAADRRATVAATFTDPRNGRMPRTLVNRIWQRLLGRGLVEIVDEMDGEPWNPELLDWLAGDFVSSGYDLKHLIATILNSRAYQLPSIGQTIPPPKEYVFRGPELRRLTAEEFADAVASITGDWRVGPSNPGFAGGRGGPVVISGVPFDGSVNTASGGQAARSVPQAPAGRGGPQSAGRGGAPAPLSPGNYTREWRLAANHLTRALGRPIRDQVYSTRDSLGTMLQALELVNGETLTHWLSRGSRRMLGELPPEAKSLLGRQVNSGRDGALVPFDLDISTSQKLYLIVQDSLSTAPDKAAPLWIQAELTRPDGVTLLRALHPVSDSGLREGTGPITIAGQAEGTEALRVKFPSVLVYDIAGKGFTRLRGATGFENVVLSQGEAVNARFFVFDQNPTMDRLVPPNPETPRPGGPVLNTASEVVDRVYWFGLGRAPSAAERRIAESALRDPSRPGKPSADGLADFLWAVLMTPEFQFVR